MNWFHFDLCTNRSHDRLPPSPHMFRSRWFKFKNLFPRLLAMTRAHCHLTFLFSVSLFLLYSYWIPFLLVFLGLVRSILSTCIARTFLSPVFLIRRREHQTYNKNCTIDFNIVKFYAKAYVPVNLTGIYTLTLGVLWLVPPVFLLFIPIRLLNVNSSSFTEYTEFGNSLLIFLPYVQLLTSEMVFGELFLSLVL